MLITPHIQPLTVLHERNRRASAKGETLWLAHASGDRATGYGPKEISGFRDTHLGRIGRR